MDLNLRIPLTPGLQRRLAADDELSRAALAASACDASPSVTPSDAAAPFPPDAASPPPQMPTDAPLPWAQPADPGACCDVAYGDPAAPAWMPMDGPGTAPGGAAGQAGTLNVFHVNQWYAQTPQELASAAPAGRLSIPV